MRIRYILYTLLLMLQVAIPEAWAQQKPESPDSANRPSLAGIRVSLLTAMPGPEVFELYGHQGLRIINPLDSTDLVYNYGIFDFNAPGFVPRFVKGETDYMVAAWPYDLFIQEYEATGRQVIEQELNLTPGHKLKLIRLLKENVKPENRIYRYQYLSNNCATQILDKLDEATQSDIIYPTDSNYDSWRAQMQHFNANYPWYQFGIDLALGVPLDRATTGREQMFMPVTLQSTIGAASHANGKPLVKSTRIAYAGRGDMREGPTPWYLTPLFIFWLLAAISATLILTHREKAVRIFGFAWMLIAGIFGCVIWYLIFISVHEATSPNILGMWAGPQCFVAAWLMLSRKQRTWTTWYMRLYALLILATALLGICGIQHLNAAMWPILLTTLMFTLSKCNYKYKAFLKTTNSAN